jgi:hypothetical protein
MQTDENMKGCYGSIVGYSELDEFLEDSFALDCFSETNGTERFATCIWSHPGIGKTAKIKQLRDKPVVWNGKRYSGYDVRSVPIAQFEEMGDLHGMPSKHIEMASGPLSRWVPVEVADSYKEQGWSTITASGIKTMYAPPEWVPTEPRPSVLMLDDWNRANGRIIKGCMQFLQEYGLMSWKLPPGCHIVLTGNPDEQDYLVTTLDPAIMQRLRSVTLKFDARQWATWAVNNNIDQRVVSFVLAYPEMAIGAERTSPRSLSEFGRYLTVSGSPSPSRALNIANSVLDEITATSIITFISRDFELIVSPEDILEGKPKVYEHLKDIMTRREKRIDVLAVTCDRLFAWLHKSGVQTTEAIKNVQRFLTSEYIEAEMRYVFVDRLNRAATKENKLDLWFLGNRELVKLIMELV